MTKGRKAVCNEMKIHEARLRAFFIAYTSGKIYDSEKEIIAECIFSSLDWIKEGIKVLQDEQSE